MLALKANQPTLHELVAHHVTGSERGAVHHTVDTAHGRLEIRCCRATNDLAVLGSLDPKQAWPGLISIAAVTGGRHTDDVITRETRYSLTSLPADAARIGQAVRAHWGIENGLPWLLDVAFREDNRRVRRGDAAENVAILRHVALALLQREPTATVGITARRLMCGWDEIYLLKVLAA